MAVEHADRADLAEYWHALQAKRTSGSDSKDSSSIDTTTPMALTFDPEGTQ